MPTDTCDDWQNSGIPMEWQGQLQHLRELGFSYENSVECMQATHGDMAKTVDLLMARQAEQEQNLGTAASTADSYLRMV